jgi:hypothetical protein
LQRRLARLLGRKTERDLPRSVAIQKAIAATRQLAGALAAAEEESREDLRRALAAALAPIADHLAGLGIEVPAPRVRRRCRPRGASPASMHDTEQYTDDGAE